MSPDGLPRAPRAISLPRRKLRSLATTIYSQSPQVTTPQLPEDPIIVVCISDTHMTQPPLPPGDLLLHAGDLSVVGSQAEIQEQLDWLSSQPHTYKVVIAGNHDVLFDPAFLEANPVRKNMNPDATASNLNLGSVIYLQDESVTLKFAKEGGERELKIYGSPRTPQYGSSAFQFPRSQDIWSGKVPEDTHILLTHGPPRNHLDGGLHAGCMNLAREIARIRPRLVVFGHVHVGYGIEEVRLDKVRSLYDGLVGGWEGRIALLEMGRRVLWEGILSKILPPRRLSHRNRLTTFVNAAVVGGDADEIKRPPIVIQI